MIRLKLDRTLVHSEELPEEGMAAVVMTTPKAYTVEEVAQILKVHPRTVYRMLDRGQLKGFKVGTVWRVVEQELEAFMRGERPE